MRVRSRQLHTYHGETYDVGETYEVDDSDVDTVIAQGKAGLAPATPTPATVPARPVLTAPVPAPYLYTK